MTKTRFDVKTRKLLFSIVAAFLLSAIPYIAFSQWQSVNIGLSNVHATSIVFNKKLYLTATEGIFICDSTSNIWQNYSEGIVGSFLAPSVNNIAFNDTNIFVGSGNGFFRASTNNYIWNGPTVNHIERVFYTHNTLFGLTEIWGIFSSGDNGLNWSEINSGLPEYYNEISYFPKTNLLFEYNDTLFLGTSNGLFKSGINKINWIETGFNNRANINSYVIDEDDIYIGTTENGIYKSVDKGVTWEEANNGLQGIYVGSLTVWHKYIFAGTEQNIFYSDNKGVTWNILGEGFPSKQVGTSIYVTDSAVYAASHSKGLWELTNPFKYNSIDLVTADRISIYPNPTSGNIILDLKIPDNIAHASLYIYDEFGRLVKKDDIGNRGQFCRIQNISQLANGLYYSRIVFDGVIVYNSKIIKK